MKLEIYEKKPRPMDEKRAVLRLTENGIGDIFVAVVNPETGNDQAVLLCISTDGTLTRCRGVGADLGFPLDEQGLIKLAE